MFDLAVQFVALCGLTHPPSIEEGGSRQVKMRGVGSDWVISNKG